MKLLRDKVRQFDEPSDKVFWSVYRLAGNKITNQVILQVLNPIHQVVRK